MRYKRLAVTRGALLLLGMVLACVGLGSPFGGDQASLGPGIAPIQGAFGGVALSRAEALRCDIIVPLGRSRALLGSGCRTGFAAECGLDARVPNAVRAGSQATASGGTATNWSFATIATFRHGDISEVVLTKLGSVPVTPKFALDWDAFGGVMGSPAVAVGGFALTHSWTVSGHLFVTVGGAVLTGQSRPIDGGAVLGLGLSF